MRNKNLKKEILSNFNKSNFKKAIELCHFIDNDNLIDFKKEIIILSNFKLNNFSKTIKIIKEFYKESELNQKEKIIVVLSLCYLNIKEFKNCISIAKKAVSKDSKNNVINSIIGIAYGELEQYIESNKYIIKCLTENPSDLEARYNYALNLFKLENFFESEREFEYIISFDKNFKKSSFMLGVIKSKLNKNNEAIEIFMELIKNGNNLGEILFNIGKAYQKMEKFLKSNEYFSKAIAINYKEYSCLNEQGINFRRLNEYDKAKKLFEKSISLNKTYRRAYNNLAILFQKYGNFEDALKNFNKAIKIDQNHALTLFNKSMCLLEMGKYEEGIELYKWRLNGKHSSNKFFDLSNIKNKTILITCDQGLGDTILFSRFLILLLERKAKILFLVPKSIFNLMQNIDHRINVILKEPNKDTYDYECSLGDLLKIFKISSNKIPRFNSYFDIPDRYIKKWNKKVSNRKFKIGIAWQGKRGTIVDEGRSIELKYFSEISKLKNVELISLQKNDGVNQIKEFSKNYKILNFDNELDIEEKFMDTAGLMKNLDLVICSDTSIPHLAGALGVKVWIILQKYPYWYWCSETTQSLWYDSMTIYKQNKINNWDEVFKKIQYDLKKVLNNNY